MKIFPFCTKDGRRPDVAAPFPPGGIPAPAGNAPPPTGAFFDAFCRRFLYTKGKGYMKGRK